MTTDNMDSLVIFGATGDLAKLETFPAPVGLVERGVLTVPVIGVGNSGWGHGTPHSATTKGAGQCPSSPDNRRRSGW